MQPRRAQEAKSQRTAEAAAVAIAHRQPEIGQFRAAAELQARGIAISPSGVRAIWKRHGLTTALQRLSLHGKANNKGVDLSATQRARLQRARVTKQLLGRERNGAANGAGRRAQLLAAAAREFSAKGYEASSLRDIAAAAGVLAGSLYYHFRSKDDLFATVHAEGFRQLHDALDRSLATVTDPWERLEAACTAHLEQLVNGNDIAVVTATSLFRTMRPALQRRLNRERDKYERRFHDLIAALKLRRSVDRSLLRLLLLGALNWTRVWYRPDKRTPAAIAQQWVRQVLAH
jgi:TetR/AcrR family transcriptional regulator, cholesterol catabolism regulator